MEVIWGHIFGLGEVKWPPICLKHWKVEYWSHYLSFDMSHDMRYKKVIVMVMEIICSHIFGHGEVKWPPIGLTLKGRILKLLPFIWCVTLHGIRKSHCCGHWGHLRLHFRSWWGQMPPICLKHWKVEYWSHYLSFDMSHDMWYAKVIVVVMEVIWGHIFCQGEVKWPPICLKHWKVEYWSHYLSFDMSHDMGYAKVIVVVMEVIWGHIIGHGEVIDLQLV